MAMRVALSPPSDAAITALLAKYAPRGGNDDCEPFRSGNLRAWTLQTRGPITKQTAVRALERVVRSLPSPYAEHLVLPERRWSEGGEVSAVDRDELRARLIGHMAQNLGGVVNIASSVLEARADVDALLAWCGPRAFTYAMHVFRVPPCFSYEYAIIADGRVALAWFLQTD